MIYVRSLVEQAEYAKRAYANEPFVCMLCSTGPEWTWYTAAVYDTENEAKEWFDAQRESAHVWKRIESGEVELFGIK